MVTRRVERPMARGIALGIAASVAGWWAANVSATFMGDAVSTLGDPQYPLGPRLLLVAAVMVTCALAIWSRPAALTMAAVAALFIVYSLLVFTNLAPAVLPLDGWADGRDPIRETQHAIVFGGASPALLVLGGVWLGIAWWWLRRDALPPSAGSVRLAAQAGIGLALAVVAWWVLPVAVRSMVVMFTQGRDAFSPLPSLVLLLLASGAAGLVLRWPGVGLGATVAALCFAAYSLLLDAPDPGLIPGARLTEWWSISVADLEQSIRSTVYRAGTLELSAAWTVAAIARIGAFRPRLGRQPATRLSAAD